jgi:hypothetical protein
MQGPEHELGVPTVEEQLESTSVESAGVGGHETSRRTQSIAHPA